jgi:hypothetical protein
VASLTCARHLLVVSAVVTVGSLVGCNDAPAVQPISPSPQVAPSPQVSTRTVTGSVSLYSHAGNQPLSGVEVGVWLEQPRSMRGGPSVRTDSAGHFSVEVPSDALVRLTGSSPGLLQPCLSTAKVDETEANIRLVTASDLLYARPDLAEERVLSGTIFEVSPEGRSPIPDAFIEIDGAHGDGLVLGKTRSDSNGKFVVCGLEGNPIHALVVAKSGYQLAAARLPTQAASALDIELRPCTVDRPLVPHADWCF